MNKDFKTIDLTHTLTPSTPTCDGSCGFAFQQCSPLLDQ